MNAAATPHYLRFARALTLAAGLAGAAGCSAVVNPGGGDVVEDRGDPTDHVDPGDAPVTDGGGADVVADASSCPPTQPAFGTPCAPVGLMCSYNPPCTGEVRCAGQVDAGVGTWSPSCAIGPLAPPELAPLV